jgi:anti-sigma-K factor RskA
MDHEELRSDCGLYVLGALRGGERTRFEEHLVTCMECRELVQSLSTVADALPYAVPLVDAPAGLRARIVAAASRARAPRLAVPPDGTAGHRTVRRLTSIAGWIAAAAGLLVAVAIGARAAGLENRLRDTEQRLRDALTRITEYDRVLQTSQQETSTVRRMLALLTAADAVEFRLAGQTPARQASARAFLSRSGGVLFAATNLPAIPPDRTYQVWYLTRSGGPVSAGLIKPDAAGGATARFDVPVAAELVGLAVSLEPDGGVPAPTGAIYLATQ